MSPRGAEPAPDAVPVPGPGSASPRPLFGGCWSCRLLSGAGLLMAAIWVYQGPRSTMRMGIPPSMGALAQIAFAAGLGAWGIVILADPVGTWHRKQP
ncbi:PREDICTED: transmembrane protein 261 [Pseudopodoces humilis]|uniref:transmembrane protein 261 n=1 Tax=Pseudopodoces humilis TaxID=181119 RepID=UPI0006B7A220|nr:PREDICTED: transmembrane protein 261 [Pseudopodoces humilis]